MKKKKILIFASFYLPGYKSGGPIRSIANLVEALSDKFQFYVVTRDRDFLEKNSYPQITSEKWIRVGKASVLYLPPEKLKFSVYSSILDDVDADSLYLNSFFDYKFSILPLLVNKIRKRENRLRVILAPRGEFSLGALKLNQTKKQFFIKVSKITSLHKNICWQASTSLERQDIQNAMLVRSRNIIVASNVPKLLPYVDKAPKLNGYLKIIWVSRISPKKNLIFALQALRNVKCKVYFNLYGLIDDQKYWTQCLRLIDELPEHIHVKYEGALTNDSVREKMAENHLFFLPTLGENFGHAIVEALLVGIPVLISTETPWRNLEQNKVGWDVELSSLDRFTEKINVLFNELSAGNVPDRKKINNWITQKILESDVIKNNEALFNS